MAAASASRRNPSRLPFSVSRARAIRISASSSRTSRCARRQSRRAQPTLDRPAAICVGPRLPDWRRRRAAGGGAYARRRRSGPRRRSNSLVRIFGTRECLCRSAAPQRTRRRVAQPGSDSHRASLQAARCSPPTASATPQHMTAKSWISSPPSATTPSSTRQAGCCGQQPASSALGARDGSALPRCRGAIANTVELSSRLQLRAERSRLRVSALPGAGWRDDGQLSAQTCRGRRYTPLRPKERRGLAGTSAEAGRARTGADREARLRRILPHRLGHRPVLQAQRHSDPGPRQRGKLRRLLCARNHRDRSGRHGTALRAFP